MLIGSLNVMRRSEENSDNLISPMCIFIVFLTSSLNFATFCCPRMYQALSKLTTLCDKIVGDLQQVSGFLQVIRFPPPVKLSATIKLKYC
jgi:hypothetical protein